MANSAKEHRIRDYIFQKMDEMYKDTERRLPSENEIARRFNISRYSVRSLYDNLEEMGLLVSKQGVGRFPNKDKPEIHLSMNSISFTKKMQAQNIPFVTKNLGVEKIQGPDIQYFHKLGLEGDIYGIKRLRILHNHPAAIHASYISSNRFPNIEEEGNKITSISQYYQDKGIAKLDSPQTKISIKFPTSQDMKILECKSLVPLLLANSIVYDKEGKVLEVTEIKYRSDIFEYII